MRPAERNALIERQKKLVKTVREQEATTGEMDSHPTGVTAQLE
jgi:ribulose 1,5-bisphosphate carboxylase large subunit-like protein